MSENLKLKFNETKGNNYSLKTTVARIMPETESLVIAPKKESQTYQGLYDTVNVEGDENLVANNIKKGVSIFGINGAYETEKVKLPNMITFKDNRDITDVRFLSYLDFSNVTYGAGMFQNCWSITSLPWIDTKNMTSISQMFSNCSKLETIPVLDFSSITGYYSTTGVFSNCPNLTDESLNNILASVITTNKTGNKTLSSLGLTQAQAETCMTLPNYDDFIAAGWTTGY